MSWEIRCARGQSRRRPPGRTRCFLRSRRRIGRKDRRSPWRTCATCVKRGNRDPSWTEGNIVRSGMGRSGRPGGRRDRPSVERRSHVARHARAGTIAPAHERHGESQPHAAGIARLGFGRAWRRRLTRKLAHGQGMMPRRVARREAPTASTPRKACRVKRSRAP